MKQKKKGKRGVPARSRQAAARRIDWEQPILHALSEKEQSAEGLMHTLRVGKRERMGFLLQLSKLERSGRLERRKNGAYAISMENTLSGRLVSLSKGFGFARLDDGSGDCFIAGRNLHGALPGDAVRLRPGPRDERGLSGEVVCITEKGARLYSGRLGENEYGRRQVEPDGFFRCPLEVTRASAASSGAKLGDKVRFAAAWDGREVLAEILVSYGSADSARVCADALIDSYGIPAVFDAQVLADAAAKSAQPLDAAALAGRRDLRGLTVLTIDGSDAKDLDDAVSLEKTDDGWRLGVHIADVSHYVTPGSPVDAEAYRRGTSVYFADRVIPMLPETLSNGACSLYAGEDRLTMSALMDFDESGECLRSEIFPSVIRSCVRGIYSEVNDLFMNSAEESVKEKYAGVLPMLLAMRELAARLREKAAARGALRLESVEARFLLDEQGRPAAVYPRVSGEAEGMIEQFMIAANVAVARFGREQGLPFLYRVHEQPCAEKLEMLADTARRLGFTVGFSPEKASPSALQELLDQAEDTPYARLISTGLLRSMAKAHYSENPIGHFGLALGDYCHFTSPIRRYPDLVVHRMLALLAAGVGKGNVRQQYAAAMPAMAEETSRCEVRAMAAERDCEACYMAEYMAGFLGRTFTGTISGMSDFGVYVELPNTAEGMVRRESLPEEELTFDGAASLRDPLGRARYTVGEEMTIVVAACDVSTGRITFIPEEKP